MAAARPERSQNIEPNDQPVVLWIAFRLSLVALLMCGRRPDTMGAFANGHLTNVAALLGTAVVPALNVFLSCGPSLVIAEPLQTPLGLSHGNSLRPANANELANVGAALFVIKSALRSDNPPAPDESTSNMDAAPKSYCSTGAVRSLPRQSNLANRWSHVRASTQFPR